LENTRVLLAGDAYDQTQLHLSFAQRRLDEMAALVGKGRYSDVELASKEFETYVEKTTSALQTLMAENPEQGALLSNQITRALLSYASILKGVQADVPVAVWPAVEHAILVSQTSAGEGIEFTGIVEFISGTTWIVSGRTITTIDSTEIKGTISIGDAVNVQAILSGDGALIAQEIDRTTTNANPHDINNGNTNDVEDETVNDVNDGNVNNGDDGAVNDLYNRDAGNNGP
jgi:hypothetical protein